MMPDCETRPMVGLMPTRPLIEAGQTTEPFVSVPTDVAHKLAAAATAEPELDPQVLRSGA